MKRWLSEKQSIDNQQGNETTKGNYIILVLRVDQSWAFSHLVTPAVLLKPYLKLFGNAQSWLLKYEEKKGDSRFYFCLISFHLL